MAAYRTPKFTVTYGDDFAKFNRLDHAMIFAALISKQTKHTAELRERRTGNGTQFVLHAIFNGIGEQTHKLYGHPV